MLTIVGRSGGVGMKLNKLTTASQAVRAGSSQASHESARTGQLSRFFWSLVKSPSPLPLTPQAMLVGFGHRSIHVHIL